MPVPLDTKVKVACRLRDEETLYSLGTVTLAELLKWGSALSERFGLPRTSAFEMYGTKMVFPVERLPENAQPLTP